MESISGLSHKLPDFINSAQPHRCDLTKHDEFLSSKEHHIKKLQPNFPECTHCRTDWTRLLKPDLLDRQRRDFASTLELEIDTIVQDIVAEKLSDMNLRVAISHFCDVSLNENSTFRPVGFLEKVLGRGDVFQVRQREQALISLLHTFYRELYLECYTFISCVVIGKCEDSKILPTVKELRHLKRQKIATSSFLKMIEMASWFYYSKARADTWDGVYEMYRQVENLYLTYKKKGLRSQGLNLTAFVTGFIRNSKALEELLSRLRRLRRPILLDAVEMI